MLKVAIEDFDDRIAVRRSIPETDGCLGGRTTGCEACPDCLQKGVAGAVMVLLCQLQQPQREPGSPRSSGCEAACFRKASPDAVSPSATASHAARRNVAGAVRPARSPGRRPAAPPQRLRQRTSATGRDAFLRPWSPCLTLPTACPRRAAAGPANSSMRASTSA